MIRGIGITEWEAPFRDERLCPWAASLGLDTVSMEFDAQRCRDEADARSWALGWKEDLEKNGLVPSILGINVLCSTGMQLAENEEACRRYVELAMYAAYVMNAPCVHLPSFLDGWIENEAQLAQALKIIGYACSLGERYGIETGYESVLWDEGYETVLSDVTSPAFFLLFDNENLSSRGKDPLRAYLRYPELYRHAHFKHAAQGDRPAPVREDTRFGGPDAVIRAMREHGFDGWVILESYYKKAGSVREAEELVRDDLSYLRGAFGCTEG